jgi:hypothetical protein
VTVFEIEETELPAFYKREEAFEFLEVEPEYLDGRSMGVKGILRQ